MANKQGWDLNTLVEIREAHLDDAKKAEFEEAGLEFLSRNSDKGTVAYCGKVKPEKGK